MIFLWAVLLVRQARFLYRTKTKTLRRSIQRSIDDDSLSEDVDAAFVDVDGNSTLDLIVVSGGQEY